MHSREERLLNVLNNMGIKYEKIDHPAVFTVEEAKIHCGFVETGCKNLFLVDKQSKKYYLVVILDYKRADIKRISKQIGAGKLTFAKEEELLQILGLIPGEVTPFGLINDTENIVTLLLDSELKEKHTVAFHPNVNTATLILEYSEFKKFISLIKNDTDEISAD